MPQMAPLYWFALFLFFSSIFILSTTVTYFIIPSQTKNFLIESSTINNMYMWKW
uniref:ATP synthase F0 subunit 8 n=1 Tax=Allanaspides helonomus TaxID=91997 RepID=UPI002A7F107A|nr:ATP synthase F0 subunit 8 [Allanaspides helonomus]WOR80943.1 ATP synthase F0 subunit 8 [Allanaspides helonomus]WOR80956.1 ATP synthase F0 subunit 8 [Allanaspides helonomus]